MTEDEAKTKTCHKTLAPLAVAEVGSFHSPAPCIASACMAWRWSLLSGPKGNPYTNAIRERIAETGESLRAAKDAVDLTWTQPSPTDGYCGLAGAPQ